jgi:hypothetical protein
MRGWQGGDRRHVGTARPVFCEFAVTVVDNATSECGRVVGV